MKTNPCIRILLLPVLALVAFVPTSEAAPAPDATPALHRDYTLDGNFVHDVGQLQLHMTNWGLIGSLPGASTTYSDAPSAMWPAGSGVDHLYEAALWIGAKVDGVSAVTTGRSGGSELRASATDPLDTIYVSTETTPNGARFPDPMPDDDGDGLEDEDPLNGRDDDGDGAVDEDFAGISEQGFRAELRDDHPLILDANPEHVPLHVEVIQKSYAWGDPEVADVVGFEFTIRPSEDFPAGRVLEDVFVGFFADPDIGPRDGSAIAADDLPFWFDGMVAAPDASLVPVQMAGALDADGDGGVSPGWFGIALIDHPTDPAGVDAPMQVGVRSFQQFVGNLPFEQGGDPSNDAERYDLLSRDEIDAVPAPSEEVAAGDYRVLVSVGPFATLEAGDEITVRFAMVVGAGQSGALTAAAQGILTGLGRTFDRDGDPSTGPGGEEFRVRWIPPSGGVVSIDDPSDPDAPGDDATVESLRPQLLRNEPNPFNPSTAIRYRLPAAGPASLSIHDVAGRHVRRVDLGHRTAGEGHWIWNGTDDAGRAVASGTYLVRLRTDRGLDTGRVVLVK